MKSFILVTTLLFVSYTCQAQFITQETKKRELQYKQEYEKYWCDDVICDTLFLEDNTPVFLSRTPMRYIAGYTGLFKSAKSIYDSEVLYTVHSYLGDYGYKINWRIKDSKLYVDRILWKRVEMCGPDKKGKICTWKGSDVTIEEIKKRFEKLTGRVFDENGKMLADWVTDAIRVTKYHPAVLMLGNKSNTYSVPATSPYPLTKPLSDDKPNSKKDSASTASLKEGQKTFELQFTKGELRQVCEIKNIGKNLIESNLH